jgi:hypothetical protein
MSEITPEQRSYLEEGWHGALDAFEEQWQARPCNLTLKELIRRTDRLLKLLRSDKFETEKQQRLLFECFRPPVPLG